MRLQVPDTRLWLWSTDQMQVESGPFSGPFCCPCGAFPPRQNSSAKRKNADADDTKLYLHGRLSLMLVLDLHKDEIGDFKSNLSRMRDIIVSDETAKFIT